MQKRHLVIETKTVSAKVTWTSTEPGRHWEPMMEQVTEVVNAMAPGIPKEPAKWTAMMTDSVPMKESVLGYAKALLSEMAPQTPKADQIWKALQKCLGYLKDL